MQLDFTTCDVFTRTRFGGNPLAVVEGGEGLPTATLQAIAREFNLSETVFVLAPTAPGAEARIRIFTPGAELPFAGHPNVGTAVTLARRRGLAADRLVLEQAAGPVEARLTRDATGLVTAAEITAPLPYAAIAPLAPAAAAACLGLPAAALRTTTHAPVVGGCGNPMAFAELADLAALAAATPDIAGFRAHLPPALCVGIHVHVAMPDGTRRARMFGPLVGVPEDPATGSANLGLAGLLLQAAGGDSLGFEVEQGIEMGRPSRLALRAWREADGAIRAAVGGGVVAVSAGRISLA